MANEIQTSNIAGLSLYFVVQNGNGQFWNTNLSLWEPLTPANWATYAVLMPEQDAPSGVYFGTFPALSRGRYSVTIYSYTSALLSTNQVMGSSPFYWEGEPTPPSTNPAPPEAPAYDVPANGATGTTLGQAMAQRDLWLGALAGLATAQEYTITNGAAMRKLVRADLPEAREQYKFWERMVQDLTPGNRRVRNHVPY